MIAYRRTCVITKGRTFLTFALSAIFVFLMLCLSASSQDKPTKIPLLAVAGLLLGLLAALITLMSICLNFNQNKKEYSGFIGFFIIQPKYCGRKPADGSTRCLFV